MLALEFEAYNINNDSRSDLSYCAMEIQLIALTIMANGAARNGVLA